MQASYHSPLEGESQKPSRQAMADAVGGGRRAAKCRAPPPSFPSWLVPLSGHHQVELGLVPVGNHLQTQRLEQRLELGSLR